MKRTQIAVNKIRNKMIPEVLSKFSFDDCDREM